MTATDTTRPGPDATRPTGVEVPITGTTGRAATPTGDPTALPAVTIATGYDPDGWTAPPGQTPPPIQVALARVARDVGAVAKSLKNEKAGYSARSIDDVLNAVHGPMTRHGVLMLPTVEAVDYEIVEVGQKRTPMRQVTMAVRYRFVGPAGDSLEVLARSEALDSGDKATNKAASAALKQALIHTLLIPIEQPDVDQDAVTYERSARGPGPEPGPEPTLPEAELATIRARLAAAPDVEAMRAGWKATGLPRVDRLTVRHRPIVEAFLSDLEAYHGVPARTETAAASSEAAEGAVPAVSSDVCETCGTPDGGHVDGCDEAAF